MEQKDQQLNGIQILVVEDNSDTREIVKFVLEQRGAAVTAVDSVPKAMDVYITSRPDIVIADIGMPDFNGYALIAEILYEDQRLNRSTPVIALTAYTSEADREQALSSGFREYMGKPFNPAELVDAISRLVGGGGPGSTKKPAA